MYLSTAHLSAKYDVPMSTVKRICRNMRASPSYRYQTDYKNIRGKWRYTPEAFEKASNERGKNEGV